MKFMVLFQVSAELVSLGNAAAAEAALAALRQYRDSELVDACYVLVAGGLALIVSAESRQDLLAALRNSAILRFASPTIFEIEQERAPASRPGTT